MAEYDNFIHLYDLGHPDVHGAHRNMRQVLDSYPQFPVSVSEVHIFDLPEWASYYGSDLDGLHMPFNFHLMAADWDALSLRAVIEAVLWNVPVGAWTNWTLGNHDEKRLATRLGLENARLAALLILTLRGTPFIYYGDELGMADVHIAEGEGRDPWGGSVSYLSRDGCRSPMQWSDNDNAGFGNSKPWLPVAPDYVSRNVESELDDPSSMLNLYRRLIALRAGSAALRIGSYLTHPSSTEEVLVYRRESDNDTKTVALNLSDEFQEVQIRSGRVLISTIDSERSEEFKGNVVLAPREGLMLGHD
jgi:alpha-glucosidase